MSNIVNITEKARNHLLEICNTEKQDYIHLSVAGGGCAGFSYKWDFTDQYEDQDEVVDIEQDKKLVIDGMSVMYLIGMEIDYKKNLFGSILSIENPNVVSCCGCGESFTV
jgi:iron-sulfur cluster insertion protein